MSLNWVVQTARPDNCLQAPVHRDVRQLLLVQVPKSSLSGRNARLRSRASRSHNSFAFRPLPAVASASTSVIPAPANVTDEEEPSARLAVSLALSDLWALLKPDWRIVAACAAATLVSVGAFVCVAPALGRVIDVISTPGSTPKALSIAIGTLGAVYVCSNVALAAQVAFASTASESLAARLRSRLFSALLRRDALFHDTSRTGEMTAWLGQDVEVLQSTVSRLLGARGLRAILETVGIVAVLLWLSWPLAIALLTAAPLVTPVVAAATARIKGASRQAQEASANASAAADEVVENVRAVRVFGAEGAQLRRYKKLVRAAHRLAQRVIRIQAVLDISGRIRNTLCVLVTLSLGAHLALAGRVSIGVCYSFFVYSFSFAFALSNVTATLGELAKGAGTVARTLSMVRRCEQGVAPKSCSTEDQELAVLQDGGVVWAQGVDNDNAPINTKSIDPIPSTPGSTLPNSNTNNKLNTIPAHRFCGDVTFDNVCFSHPSGWQMRGLSLHIPAGNTLALVGPSGGGKSTVASLLLGLYRPTGGRILIDGYDLDALDLDWWRRHVGVVEQAPGLLTGRVMDVVRYGMPEASKDAVGSALAAAQATGFVEDLPGGIGAVVGPGGAAELSGGQRQRLALARALMKSPKVLVLDEATSALDVGTEAAVTAALEGLPGSTTKVIIAHRLSTVRRADVIAVVVDGEVVEAGNHEELMALGGVYAGMVKSQEQGGQEEEHVVVENGRSWDVATN